MVYLAMGKWIAVDLWKVKNRSLERVHGAVLHRPGERKTERPCGAKDRVTQQEMQEI